MTHVDVLTMEELLKENIQGYLPILLEVYNPDIVWTEEEKKLYGQDNCYIRFISDENKVIYNGHTWLPCAFNYTPPDVDGTKVGNASISISALDARVKMLLRTITVASEISVIATFAKVEKEEGSGKFIYKFVKLNSLNFTAPSASCNNTTATFNLLFDRALSMNVPVDVATEDRVPSATK